MYIFVDIVYMKKIILYDGSGKPVQCIVFTGTTKKMEHQEMFSEIEMEIINLHKPSIIQSEMCIYNDDNIRSIKKKILKEFSETKYGYDEIYLFYSDKLSIEQDDLYNTITHNGKIRLTKDVYAQIRMNFQYPFKTNEQIKGIYQEPDVKSLDVSKITFFKPVGLDFANFVDYRYSANPFDVLQTDEEIYRIEGNNLLSSMDNKLLLNYGSPDTIHCCFADDICNYALQQSLNQEYFIKNYYPQLYQRRIKNSDDLLSQRVELINYNKKILDQSSFEYYKIIHLLHQIQENKKQDLDYITNGHKKMTFNLLPSQEFSLPIHSIFKILHVSKTIPIMKYTFSASSDKLMRVFTIISQKTGKSEAYLPKKSIINYSNKKHDNNTISFFLQSKKGYINADLYTSGLIKYQVIFDDVQSLDVLENEIKDVSYPLIKMLNEILLQYGISINYFESIYSDNTDVINIDYHKIISSSQNIKLSKCRPLISSIFDITNAQYPIKMLYKRVENYKKMNAINKMINDTYNETNDESKVIKILEDNFNMSSEDAMKKISEFFNGFTRINNKLTKTINIVESPGFNCIINYDSNEKKLLFEAENITNIKYIEFIRTYVNSLFMILLSKDNIELPVDIIDNACKTKAEDKDIQKKVSNQTDVNDIREGATIQPILNIHPYNMVDTIKTEPTDADELLFSSDSDEDDESESDEESDEEESDEEVSGGNNKNNILTERGPLFDNQPIGRPNIVSKRLQKYEPNLFLKKKEGNFNLFSRSCLSSNHRHPILVTDEEKKEIDKNYKGSYEHSIEYGSDPNTKYHYICPRYWCLLTNTSLTEEQAKSGMCGKIIPKGAKKIPQGHYIFEYNHKDVHVGEKGSYHYANPGFLKGETPDGHCIPCCFGKQWGEDSQQDRIEKCIGSRFVPRKKQIDEKQAVKQIVKTDKYNPYIIEFNTYPIPENRLGFLHPTYEKVLGIDYTTVKDKNKSHYLRTNISTFLRIGSDNNIRKSFLSCLLLVYNDLKNIRYQVSLNSFISTIAEVISIDDFIRYNNGSLISIFQTQKIPNVNISKYSYSILYNSLDIKKENDYLFLEKCISSYENFKTFIVSDKTLVDHTYLWDIITDENNPILGEPFNLVIMEMPEDDITNNINFICPTNAYSNHIYNPNWKSILLVKTGPYYELVCSVKTMADSEPVIKTFYKLDKNENISTMMTNIINHTLSVCKPKKSIPQTLNEYVDNIDATRIINILKKHDYIIVNQVINYQSKVIGLQIKENEDMKTTIFVPTLPSSIMKGLNIVTIDDIYWNDYDTTIKRLRGISNKTKKVLCLPQTNISQDGKIVGILTETNQFIQTIPIINEVEQNPELKTINDSNYILADNILTTEAPGSSERREYVKNVRLENDFYNAFKNIIRNILIYPTNKTILDKTKSFVNDPTILFKYKMEKMIIIINTIIEEFIEFIDYDDKVLEQLDSITNCIDSENKHYCSVQNNGINTLLIPKKNLNDTSIDNSKMYVEKLAYEIIYNKNIQDYFFNNKLVVYIPDTHYSVNKNEIIIPSTLIQSILKPKNDIVTDAENLYITQNVYENAVPTITQSYTNKITRARANVDINEITADNIHNCIDKFSETLLGSPALEWNKVLPKTSEILFGNIQECSFYICQHIFKVMFSQEIRISEIKNKLWNTYNTYLRKHNVAINDILSNEAKKPLIDDIKKGELSHFSMISDINDYYLSLLDFIVFAVNTNIPIMFINNSPLKHLQIKNNMLLTTPIIDTSKKYFIIRIHNIDKKHKFSLLQGQYLLSDIINYEKLIDGYTHYTLKDILTNYTI